MSEVERFEMILDDGFISAKENKGGGWVTWVDYAALQQKLDEKERILEGVSQVAIDGGWTAKGLSDYAKSLEQKLDAAEAKMANLVPDEMTWKDSNSMAEIAGFNLCRDAILRNIEEAK